MYGEGSRTRPPMGGSSEKGVRSAQETQVGQRIPVGIQLWKAEINLRAFKFFLGSLGGASCFQLVYFWASLAPLSLWLVRTMQVIIFRYHLQVLLIPVI